LKFNVEGERARWRKGKMAMFKGSAERKKEDNKNKEVEVSVGSWRVKVSSREERRKRPVFRREKKTSVGGWVWLLNWNVVVCVQMRKGGMCLGMFI
jgi:hypothetical protein